MYELSLIPSLSEIGSGLWSEFEGPSEYPFLRYEWLSAFEVSGTLGESRGWVARHVVIKRGREVIAVAPAYIKLNSYGEFVFDQGWAEFSEARLGVPYYPKLILAVPFTPATGPRVLVRRGATLQDREAVLDLLTGALPEVAQKLGLSSVHFLFPDELSADELEKRGFVLRLGMQFQYHNPGHCTFDEFLGSFRAKRRAAIRRECRELERAEIAIEVLTGPTFLAEDADLAYRLYLTTVDKHVWGRRYLTRAFFDSVVSSMPEDLQLVLAKDKAGEVLGGAFNLVGKHALYGRYWGAFSDVPYLHFNVCLYRGVQECIRLGLSRFEPGAGGEHKVGRGFSPTITRSVHFLREPQLASAVRDFCRREGDAILAHVAASSGSTDCS